MSEYLGQKWTAPDGVITYLGAKYYVSGYAGPNHPDVLSRRLKVGDLLGTTWNIGSSKDTEVAVWKIRISRGEASRVEVILNGIRVEECPVHIRLTPDGS